MDDIHWTLKCVLEESLEADHKIDTWLHFHTNVNITAFMLLTS